MSDFLKTPIEFLKGVGPQRAELLQKELGIFTFGDLLNHFPFRYADRSMFNQVRDLPFLDGYAQLKGVLTRMDEVGSQRTKRLQAKFQDSTGTIDLVWYQGIKWIKPTLKLNVPYIIYGKAKAYGTMFQISHPEIQEVNKTEIVKGLKPIYSSTEKLSAKGLHSKGLEKLTETLVKSFNRQLVENLPLSLVKDLHLLDKESAVKQVHVPTDDELLKRALFRLKFEELFFLQMELLLRKQIALQKNKGFVFDEVGTYFLNFYDNHLPFELTNAQKRVIKEIRQDCRNGFHMNRLIQGDVGSGKTMVAFLSMLIAVGNGYQTAMMAPTEILSQQHFESIKGLAEKIGVRVEKLSGSTKKAERKLLHEALLNGEIDILIGTHALIEDTVQFKNLGLVVIDEQHRFGVEQRSKLWRKNVRAPHILVMTATPIPRTLAMTLYGDLDVSVIDELPPGRKPITTQHRFEKSRLAVFEFMRKEIALGRQIYVVFPLIAESEAMDYHNLMAGFESISRAFPMPQYQISIVHGQQKADVKDFEMQRFVKGETHIMVATTVIEVGVNVPNASVMLIESAERFGLSQLHQLRGRVGRGAEKSYCILMTGQKLSKEAIRRLETMVETQDGFQIAEVDLDLRGPGDIMGTQQSGILDLKIADLSKDGDLVVLAREKAREILLRDPNLIERENTFIREQVINILKEKPNWGRIS